jgi:hypothetical protein
MATCRDDISAEVKVCVEVCVQVESQDPKRWNLQKNSSSPFDSVLMTPHISPTVSTACV